MRKNLSLLMAATIAMALAACVAAPANTGAVKSSFTGFATLSSVGTFEYEAAPTWTRMAQVRHNAARALTGKEITADIARRIQARADLARSLLNEAMAADKVGNRSAARDKLRWATAAVDDAEITLKGTP